MPDPYWQWDWFLWNLLFVGPFVLLGVVLERISDRGRKRRRLEEDRERREG